MKYTRCEELGVCQKLDCNQCKVQQVAPIKTKWLFPVHFKTKTSKRSSKS